MPKIRRERAVGRLGTERGERYALLPEEVMTSGAYLAQPDWSRVVLFALAARFNGRNNGDLSLPFSEAQKLGVNSQWKLYAGLRLLEHAGLIVCTRRGRVERGTKVASLYAVTWRGIEPSEKHDAPLSSALASNAWARWERPSDWRATVSAVQRSNRGSSRSAKSPHTRQSGEGRSPLSGATTPEIAPDSRVKETASVAPDSQETSKTSGVGSQPKPVEPRAQPVPDPPEPRAVAERTPKTRLLGTITASAKSFRTGDAALRALADIHRNLPDAGPDELAKVANVSVADAVAFLRRTTQRRASA